MKTTFDQFITNDPKERELFAKEYNDFLLSEFVLEKMEEEQISVRTLAGYYAKLVQTFRKWLYMSAARRMRNVRRGCV